MHIIDPMKYGYRPPKRLRRLAEVARELGNLLQIRSLRVWREFARDLCGQSTASRHSGVRASVIDGSSPNNNLYAPAKRPKS
jgi:hypothetical protein